MLERRFGLGAELVDGGVSFRVFCDRSTPTLHIDGQMRRPMQPEGEGYHSLFVPDLRAGARYGYMIGDTGPFPDPASRAQPQGPHHLSEVIDPSAFAWSDADWPGCRMERQIIYEIHVGAFTPEGTWAGAIAKLPHLRETGITLIEMMPIASFPGSFGWGYDGVALFAPTHLYGGPDDLRAFVDAAHAIGIGVILDVVYNHLGPDGNYLASFSDGYVTQSYENDWGDALDFERPGAPMREMVLENARYWIDDFHFDGLRLDATQSIFDSSVDHVIADIARRCRSSTRRDVIIVGENEPEHGLLFRTPEQGGYGLDALWNDDFHHSALVAVTGRNGAYYEDHRGSPQELISAAKYGFLFQGQFYAHQAKRRGEPALRAPPGRFVTFIENHDQIANSGHGKRVHQLTSPGALRAVTALLLLMPSTPMLFQGQEFCASAPFLYFADHEGELAKQVAMGRIAFLSQFDNLASPTGPPISLPHERETFLRCKLDWSEAETKREALALHRELIALRQNDPVLCGDARLGIDGSVVDDACLLLRIFGTDDRDFLLFVNFGRDLKRRSLPDPLVAAPAARRWVLAWSSEHPDYGGDGITLVERPAGWYVPGQTAVLLRADSLPDQ